MVHAMIEQVANGTIVSNDLFGVETRESIPMAEEVPGVVNENKILLPNASVWDNENTSNSLKQCNGHNHVNSIELNSPVHDDEWKEEIEVSYRVDESPPFGFCVLLGFQHYLSMFVATLTIPMLLAPAMCMDEDNVGKSEIIGTLFVASGIITLLQTTLGVRLPIVQAGTFALLVPTLSYLNLPEWKCPDNFYSPDMAVNNSHVNLTNAILIGSAEHRELWMARIREIQGAIMCASVLEIVLGATGVVGMMLRYIGPLSIFPTVSLLGLSLFKSAAVFAAKQWWICLLTVVLMIIFSQCLGKVNVPIAIHNPSKGCKKYNLPLFRMFPVILAVIITWLFCLILTKTGVLPSDKNEWGYSARTDIRLNAIYASPWFRFPYPGQWGMPTVSLSGVCAILAGIIATTVESVGDYYACAKLAGAPPPPRHAINRGILVEGIGSLIDGLLGTGNGTTSTSINVGVVGITKVGSRRVVQCSAVFMIFFGLFTKFGAFFITIPDPIIGGTFFVLFSMIVAVGISSLQRVDMNSSRNLFIIGFSLFAGLALPQWILANRSSINTGNETIDGVVYVLLSTGMFVGGMIGFTLDNLTPGTEVERGLAYWKNFSKLGSKLPSSSHLQQRLAASYDLPFGMSVLARSRLARYIPFLPTFQLEHDKLVTHPA